MRPLRMRQLPAIIRGLTLAAALSTCAFSARADEARQAAGRAAESIVVTAKRFAIPDEVVTKQIETALHSEPYFYDGHVTVIVKNGIAHLQGIVFDDWDLRIAMRAARKIPGVRRVVNELEISSNGSD